MGAWITYGALETGQVAISNRDRRSALAIVAACEKRDAEAEKATIKHKRLK